jgi:TolA-binding protein
VHRPVFRKAKSAKECPKEHELIKTINQDLKTKTFKLSQLEDQLEQVQTRYKKLDQDHDTQTNKKTTVSQFYVA